MMHDKAADCHERASIGLHVVREIDEQQLLREIVIQQEKERDVRRSTQPGLGPFRRTRKPHYNAFHIGDYTVGKKHLISRLRWRLFRSSLAHSSSHRD
jgi:hypothetical protein